VSCPNPGKLLALFAAVTVLVFAGSLASVQAQNPDVVLRQMSTAERLNLPGWWPTKPFGKKSDYVGSEYCKFCHSAIFETQTKTAMARTMMPASESFLRQQQKAGKEYDLSLPPFLYNVSFTAPQGPMFKVTDGQHSRTAELQWAFGTGRTGQSYIWSEGGRFYESRFSYFSSLKKLDLTPGRLNGVPEDLEMATGRVMAASEAKGCFACHASAREVASDNLDPHKMIPGISCEGCHGPGAAHVAAEESGGNGATAIFNPGRLKPTDLVDFCGACHGSYWDIELRGGTGPVTVRSPGYRLEKSQCWVAPDPRITCVACHDPHVPLVKQIAAYDQKCLACHNVKGAQALPDHPGAACPVAKSECASCHMKKVDVPEMFMQETDHFIRIVRKGEVFPE